MSREHNLTGLQLQNILALINLQSQLVILCKGRERAESGHIAGIARSGIVFEIFGRL